MTFLPDDYESPKETGFYMKFQEGENRFRILSSPIFGWEDWKDGKPVRYRKEEKPDSSFDSSKPMKYFWAFIVYNYVDQQVQILHLTQSGIRKRIEQLCKDEDWGVPYEYDMKVIRKGNGKETEYQVNPVPHKPVDPQIVKAFIARPCKLEALFSNDNPFAEGHKSYTPIFNNKPVKVEKLSFSEQQALSQEVQ